MTATAAGERDIGRGDVQILRRQGVTLAVEAGREQGDHGRREQEPDDCERDDGERHDAEYVVEEPERTALALRLLDAQPHRHEGGVERALGQAGAGRS